MESKVSDKVTKVKEVCREYLERVEKTAHRNDSIIEDIQKTYETFKKVAYDPHMQN